MKRLLFLIALGISLMTTPCFAESDLNDAQKAMVEQCLAPIKSAQKDLVKAGELLMRIRNGEQSAGAATSEVKVLLDSIAANHKLFMEMEEPEDAEVAKIVVMYMRWNGGKLGTYTNILIQLSTELLNKPDTDATLADVLKNSFFASSLHSLSEYPAEDLAAAEAEIQMLKQFSDCAREFISTLDSVSNKEEADAAAPRVKQLLEELVQKERQVRTLSPVGKSKIHQEIIQTAGYSYGFPLIMMELEKAVDSISGKHKCFGSSALKEIMDAI